MNVELSKNSTFCSDLHNCNKVNATILCSGQSFFLIFCLDTVFSVSAKMTTFASCTSRTETKKLDPVQCGFVVYVSK